MVEYPWPNIPSGSLPAIELGPPEPRALLYICEPSEYNEEKDILLDSLSAGDMVVGVVSSSIAEETWGSG